MKIAFYHHTAIHCDLQPHRFIPLGGTESALLFMAEALAKSGCEVHIFTHIEKERCVNGVNFHHLTSLEKKSENLDLDVFICIRQIIPALVKRWAKLQIYFSPDAYDQPFVNQGINIQFQHQSTQYQVGLYSLEQLKDYVDAFFCVGEWQAETFISKFKIPSNKVHVVSNGVYLPDFKFDTKLSERKTQLVYTSTPFRGLENLLHYFPLIKNKVPDAQLLVMSGMQVYGISDEQDKEHYQHIYRLCNQDGVILKGSLNKIQMAHHLKESRVLAYPNKFAETFCIAALEAQASGLPVVSTSMAAMKERVQSGVDGFLVEGHPDQQEYRNIFVNHVVELLTNDDLWNKMSRLCIEKADNFSYEKLSKQWIDLFKNLLNQKTKTSDAPLFFPKDQTCDILVDGYPKRLSFKASFLGKMYADSLDNFGLKQCASQIRKMCVSLGK